MAKKASFTNFDISLLDSVATLQKRPQTIASVSVEYDLPIIAGDGITEEDATANYAMCKAYADFFKSRLNEAKEEAARTLCPDSFVSKIRTAFLNDELCADAVVEWLLYLGVNPDGCITRTKDDILLSTKSLVLSGDATRKAETKYAKSLEKAKKTGKSVIKPQPLKKNEEFQRGLAEGFCTWAISLRKALILNEDGSVSLRGRKEA